MTLPILGALALFCFPADQPAQTPAASPSKSSDRVTIHYHRQDGNYDAVNIWTWDGDQQRTPEQNSLTPTGRDDFGPVFQFNRSDYGASGKIGLIPRLEMNWRHKDGGDRFWTPALGSEVWLLSGKPDIFTAKPDTSPQIESAYIDGPNTLVVSLTDAPRLPAKASILDQQNAVRPVQAAFPTNKSGHPMSIGVDTSCKLIVVPKEPLDVVSGHYRIQIEGFGQSVPLVPRAVLENRDLFFDADARLGALYTPQGTTFRLFAPTASAVSVVLYDGPTGPAGRTVQKLQAQPRGLWDGTVSGDLRGKCYVYVLDGPGLNPAREVVDPYAVNTVASTARALIIGETKPPQPGPRAASPTDMVIYEMHVRDFTEAANSGVKNRGLYLGFGEANTRLPGDAALRTALDHLVELGVTHVQLLPVQDFADNEASPNYNWGYIPTAYFSPEGMYATNPNDDSRVRELKTLVDALHARGLGVIMDVVYNHTATDPSFDFLVPGYYYRHDSNGASANGSGCGNELRTEAPMARKLVVDSLVYWAREYGIDGYRFDLMSLVDQDTIRQAEKELHALNPSMVLFGEPWAAGASPLQMKSDKAAMRQLPVGAFNDNFRNALKGSPDGRDAGFIQRGLNRDALKDALLISGWLASPAQSINYMTCHDNLVLWDKLKLTMPRTAGDGSLIDAMKLGYLTLFTAQGVPFIQGGEEFARTKGGNNNSYDAPDAVNEVDWSLKRKHFDLFTYTRDAIALRKAHPVFRLRTSEDVAARLRFVDALGNNGRTLAYTLDASGVPGESWKRACVILNGDDTTGANVPLPEGNWSVALDERGTASPGRTVSGKVTVRPTSGLVLYQP